MDAKTESLGSIIDNTNIQCENNHENDKENDVQKPSEQIMSSYHTGRAMRKEGQRNLHVSSFTVSNDNSSDQTDEGKKTSIRVKEPPGGKSSGFW